MPCMVVWHAQSTPGALMTIMKKVLQVRFMRMPTSLSPTAAESGASFVWLAAVHDL